MKRLGLDATNSTYLSRKIYSNLFQEASPPKKSVSALRWAISRLITLVVFNLGEMLDYFIIYHQYQIGELEFIFKI